MSSVKLGFLCLALVIFDFMLFWWSITDFINRIFS